VDRRHWVMSFPRASVKVARSFDLARVAATFILTEINYRFVSSYGQIEQTAGAVAQMAQNGCA
jgi:hypothetical protein